MHATHATHADLQPASGRRSGVLAAAGVALSAAAMAVGTFTDLTGNETGERDGATEYAFSLGTIAVIATLAYGLGVRGAERGSASRRAAVLGVLAAATFIVFWTGAPLVLASASVACALVDRDRLGSFGAGSKIGLTGSTLAAVSAVVLAIVG